MDLLISSLTAFLKKHLHPSDCLLLAYSGGPDSTALLHALLECRKEFNFDLSMAHVDHGWRKESQEEAESARKIADKYNLPFFLKKLEDYPDRVAQNLEDFCRNERHKFFTSLCKENGFNAVLMGHHRDDLGETALKRIFEGAQLTQISGMTPISQIDDLLIWRPFLNLTKQQIVNWLEEKGIKCFYDMTNEDPKFLRGRMRVEILPFLSKTFGQQISSSLAFIAEESSSLRQYMDCKISPFLSQLKKNRLGSFLDLSESPILSFELKYLIRKCCQMEGFSLSRQALSESVAYFENNRSNVSFVPGLSDPFHRLADDCYLKAPGI